MIQLAHQHNDDAAKIGALAALGTCEWMLGNHQAAERHYNAAFDIWDPKQHANLAIDYGEDPCVMAKQFAAWSEWCLGWPDRALETMGEARSMAENTSHALTKAFVNYASAWLHQRRREPNLALKYAEAGLVISENHSLAVYEAVLNIPRAWAVSMLQPEDKAILDIQQGIRSYQDSGVLIMTPHLQIALAEALIVSNQPENALAALNGARDHIEMSGERTMLSDVMRLEGTVALMRDDANSAERSIQRALEVATEQQALSLELRAARDLARLWRGQGKTREAHNLLAPVYGWFTEGFDTPDLKDAKALLEELG